MDDTAIVDIICRALEIDRTAVTNDTVLAELAEYDSLGVVMLVGEVNETLGITLDVDNLATCDTIGALVALIKRSE